MSTLDNLLRPIARLLNRNIADSIQAQKLCAELDGRVIEVRLRDTALATWFVVNTDTIDLRAFVNQEADAMVEGSVAGFLRVAAGKGEDAIRDRAVRISGDAETAQAFQALLYSARPDFEEELSNLVGDMAAFRAGEFGRGLRQWSQNARATMGDNIREYLQEEVRELPSRLDVSRFGDSVNTLRDDVDRLEARVRRIEDKSS